MRVVFEIFPLENRQGLEKSKAGKTSTEYSLGVSPYRLSFWLPCLHLPAVLLDVRIPALP